MDLFDLEQITDNEKKNAFDVALGVVKESKADFFEALKTTIMQIISNKKAKKNSNYQEKIGEESQNFDDDMDMILESAGVEAQNLYDQGMIYDGGQEQARKQHEFLDESFELASNEEISRSLVEEKESLLSKIFKIANRNKNIISASPFIDDAKSGVIDDPEFFDAHDYGIGDVGERSEFVDHLMELNEKSREIEYFDYMTMDDEMIDEERNREVNNYDNLINYYESNEGKWNIKSDSATISVDNLLSKIKARHGSGRRVSTFGNNFDDLYALATTHIGSTKKGEPYSKKIYDEMISAMRKVKDKLVSMGSKDFRNYKISSMELSPEEFDLFNSDINDRRFGKIEEESKVL